MTDLVKQYPDTPPEVRPCPACPDGGVWTSEGPTGKLCPVCKGHALVNMDGSPLAFEPAGQRVIVMKVEE